MMCELGKTLVAIALTLILQVSTVRADGELYVRLKYEIAPNGNPVRDLQYAPGGSRVVYGRGGEHGGAICIAPADGSDISERVLARGPARLGKGALRC